MYHLTRLVVKNARIEELHEILSQILKVENNHKLSAIWNLTLEEGETVDYDAEFDEDLYECIDPALMKLPKGARAYTYYTEEQ